MSKNRFLIPSQFSFENKVKKVHPSILIYFDNLSIHDANNNEKGINDVLQIVNSNLKKRNVIEEKDSYYSHIELSNCKILYPKDDYELLKRSTTFIEI